MGRRGLAQVGCWERGARRVEIARGGSSGSSGWDVAKGGR